MYKIAAIIGEAGSGKDTIINQTLLQHPELFHKIINYTSRPKREKEIEGSDYYFVDEQTIINKIFDRQMLEVHSNVWLYGTSYSELSQEKINIGVFTPFVLRKFLVGYPEFDLQIFSLKVSEKERLMRQLGREQNPDVKEIIRRFGTDTEDFSNLNFELIEISNEGDGSINAAIDQIVEAFGPKTANI
jgi:guanylate kinase